MEMIFELILEFFTGVTIEFFFFLGKTFFPDKNLTREQKKKIDKLSRILTVIMVSLFFLGIVLLIIGIDDKFPIVSVIGGVFLGISAAFILAGIILRIIKKRKNENNKKS